MKKLNYSQKMGLTAGSAALLAPAVGQAVLIHFDESHAISFNRSEAQPTEWDVDGFGTNDFYLYIENSKFFQLNSDDRNGSGMVNTKPGNEVNALIAGFTVGATLAGDYNWGSSSIYSRGRDMLFNTVYNNQVGDDFINGTIGSNFIGFRFDLAGTHYGWAEIILGTGEVTIKQWAYNDVAEAAITVGQTNAPPPSAVPEPSSLALLAAGAAGFARLRRRKHNARHQA